MAAYVEGKGWTATADSGGRQKFWGRSMEYMPEGTTTIKFKELDCEYTIDERPSVFVRNIMSGTKYIENQGELKINASTGEKATIKFEQSGWGGGSKNKVSGELKDSNGKSAAKLEGKWDEERACALSPSGLRADRPQSRARATATTTSACGRRPTSRRTRRSTTASRPTPSSSTRSPVCHC